jgi:hypothetical protein
VMISPTAANSRVVPAAIPATKIVIARSELTAHPR